MLLALGIWIIRQEQELAEKRAADDRVRVAAFAGQELSARLEAVTLRAVAGGVMPLDREIALFASLESGDLRFPWQSADRSSPADARLADAQRMMLVDETNAIAQLRQISKQAAAVGTRAKAALLLTAALRRAGKSSEDAAAAEKDLRALPVH